MSFLFTYALANMLAGLIKLNTDDIRAMLVMGDSTADVDQDAEFVSDIAVLDEFDGSGYSRVSLTSESVAASAGTNRGSFISDPIAFGALGAGARAAKGLIFYQHVTNDNDSRLIGYLTGSGGLPFTGNGENRTVTPHADGWFVAANAN